uniref:Amino acid permease/ SLC12A domain-containing protein n=1 Tax=Parascaris equorum TaxID=6256 RepID=A0A914RF35_PAREQ
MVAVLICGTLNSNIFCGSRCMYAAAREGHLPAFLSCTHERNGSPRAAVLAQGIITTVLTFVNVNKLIECVSFVMSFQRVATMLALLWIHYKKIPVHPGEAVYYSSGFAIFHSSFSSKLSVLPVSL